MKTRKLELTCPECGSPEIVYTCTPGCCFNHACANCATTFEPVTHAAGPTVTGIAPPDLMPDASDPTVECVKCYSTDVYLMDGGAAVCGKCGAVLVVELTEVAPG